MPRPLRPAAPGLIGLHGPTGQDRRTARTRRRARALAASLVLCLAAPSLARAAEYETFIEVDDEDDLLELNTAGDISPETFETLVELLRRGVDLNAAKRDELFTLPNLSYAEVDAIIKYREEVGFIHDPAALVINHVVDAKLLRSIAPFIYIRDPGVRYASTSGRVRLRTAWSPPDRRAPAMALDGQVQTLRHLNIGVAGVLVRNRVNDVRYDPVRDALSAEAPSPTPTLPKIYAQWDTDKWVVHAGSYRAGFGQRLTFDNSRNYTPNGIYRDNTIYPRPVKLSKLCRESTGELDSPPCDGDLANTYVTPDFRWQQTMQGLAVGLKRLEIGPGWLQAYAFSSVMSKQLYQYYSYDADKCADPRDDDNPSCSAPDLYIRQDDPLAPSPTARYQTLPRMYRDITAGGNVSYFFNRRSWIGATGYGTDITWLVKGKNLDFQESQRVPFGGPFGAVGLNGAWGRRWSDLGVEVARSFDSMKKATLDSPEPRGGGGFAALLRWVASWKTHEIETIVRYYDRDYANPYARPLAGRDQFEGQRARDEAGLRVRYTGRVTAKMYLQTWLNFWVSPTSKVPSLHTRTRLEYQARRWFIPAAWFEGYDRDVRTSGAQYCYGGSDGLSDYVDGGDGSGDVDTTVDYGYEGGIIYNNCRGETMKYNLQAAFLPHRRVKLVPRFQHRFMGDPESTDITDPDNANQYKPGEPQADPRRGYRQDISAWLTLSARPVDPLRIRTRVRYQNFAIDDNTYLEHSLWSYLEVGYLFKKTFLLMGRYDNYVWLDQRDSTLLRIPSPEHRFLLTLEGRF
jgi:DNA uptake protein ComE-like DNA-binding protein